MVALSSVSSSSMNVNAGASAAKTSAAAFNLAANSNSPPAAMMGTGGASQGELAGLIQQLIPLLQQLLTQLQSGAGGQGAAGGGSAAPPPSAAVPGPPPASQADTIPPATGVAGANGPSDVNQSDPSSLMSLLQQLLTQLQSGKGGTAPGGAAAPNSGSDRSLQGGLSSLVQQLVPLLQQLSTQLQSGSAQGSGEGSGASAPPSPAAAQGGAAPDQSAQPTPADPPGSSPTAAADPSGAGQGSLADLMQQLVSLLQQLSTQLQAGGATGAPQGAGAAVPPSAPPSSDPSSAGATGPGSAGNQPPGPSGTPSTVGSGSVGASGNVAKPAGSINVKDFGATGNGSTDDTAALQKAFDAAKATGQTVFIGAGTYSHGGVLNANGIQVTGAGDGTVLVATNPNESAIKLTGNGASLSNVQTQVSASTRSSMPDAAGVLVQNATNASVSNVTVKGAASNGIRLDNASSAKISSNLVEGTNADGIALMNGSSNNTVSKNEVSQAGDDAFSDDSYTSDAKQDTGNAFTNNLALNNAYGRGFALMGSANDLLEGNVSDGTPGNGIIAGTDGNSGTRAGSGDTIKNNTVIGAKDTPISANGMSLSGNSTNGASGDIAALLGWAPATQLTDRSAIAAGYQPGTGNGANNAGGVRT